MGKNWLIRTKSYHILGPVSKEKVVELYQNGSIKPDDEVCSGNGYWFYIRESDLIDLYLLGNKTQSFNPISEAKDVLTSSQNGRRQDTTRDDITLVGALNLNKINEASVDSASVVPVGSKSAPEASTQSSMKIPVDLSDKKKVKSDSSSKQSVIAKRPAPVPGKQNYLKYLAFFAFVILFLVIYFRKTIVKSFLEKEVSLRPVSSLIISEAHAQKDESSEKKKSF